MNEEQQTVFDAVVARRSVLMTGAGGVGKSYVIQKIVEWAIINNIPHGVTAMTGCAAILLGGTTLHSFLGIGLGTKTASELVRDLTTKRKPLATKLSNLELLIVDEVSMLNSEITDLISEFLCLLRGNPNPFGGVQMVLSGDLYQIPPINAQFFFKSKIWKIIKANIHIVDLKHSQRHKDDKTFDEILQKLRKGQCDNASLQALIATESNTFKDGIKPTVMYTKNVDVDIINATEMEKITSTGVRALEYTLKVSSPPAKAWATSCKVPESVKLCVGAQVMLTWNVNLEEGLCNGSRGVVTAITTTNVTISFQSGRSDDATYNIEYVTVEHPDNKRVWIKFMPIRLAYALTVNKAQGMTLDAAIIDMDTGGSGSMDFLYGKFYTAISRVRDISCIIVKNARRKLFVAHPDVVKLYARMEQQTPEV